MSKVRVRVIIEIGHDVDLGDPATIKPGLTLESMGADVECAWRSLISDELSDDMFSAVEYKVQARVEEISD